MNDRSSTRAQHVVIIGGGLGGLSAAICLAAAGYRVSIYEKNSHLGGKVNVHREQGFCFDLGPSVFTLPVFFESLFARAGRRFADFVTLVPVEPQWRNFFEDGTRIDLYRDDVRMAQELAPLGEGEFAAYLKFKNYARRQYTLVEQGYFAQGLDTFAQMVRHYGWTTLFGRLDSLRVMDTAVRRHFKSPYLIDIFNFFSKYIGSSPRRAPAFLNLLSHIQLGDQLWYVSGGFSALAQAMRQLLEQLGAEIFLGCEVTRINDANDGVSGITLSDGRVMEADVVISNMEVIPTHQRLLGETATQLRRWEKFEPACSGLVMHLGIDTVYSDLAHHNFFYAREQNRYFSDLFDRHALPDDPTVYVVAPTRSDPSLAPAGCDIIKILTHVPHLNYARLDSARDQLNYGALRERVMAKLERMGLSHLHRHIVVEHSFTPDDISRLYFSDRGAIYGTVADRRKNWGFKAPKRSDRFRNLYFVGGSVNPGGGMPMVVLGGQKVADCVIADYPLER